MGPNAEQSLRQMQGMSLINDIHAVAYQMAQICSKRRGPEANGTTQSHCNRKITSTERTIRRCQKDLVNSACQLLHAVNDDDDVSKCL